MEGKEGAVLSPQPAEELHGFIVLFLSFIIQTPMRCNI